MTNSWLPPWLAVVWVVVMAAVAAVHVRHLVTLPDVTRAWHTGHVLMAVGMGVMFFPGGALLTPTVGVAGRAAFVVAALAAATWAVVDRRRRGRWTTVWPLLAADLAAMVWMFTVMAPGAAGMRAATATGGSTGTGPSWVNAALALWFLVETARWATGALVRSAERDLHLELPTDLSLLRESAAARSGAGGRTAAPARRDPDAPPTHGHAWHGISLRLTLTAMTAGMALMFAATAFGASSMPMSGM